MNDVTTSRTDAEKALVEAAMAWYVARGKKYYASNNAELHALHVACKAIDAVGGVGESVLAKAKGILK